MTLREEKLPQIPALVSHKVPGTRWGDGKQLQLPQPVCALLPASADEFCQRCPPGQGGFALLIGSYPLLPSFLKSPVKQLQGVSVSSCCPSFCAQSFPFPVPTTARGVNTKRPWLKVTTAPRRRRRAWRPPVHVSWKRRASPGAAQRWRGRERRAQAPGSGRGRSPRETLPSRRSLPGSPRARHGAGRRPLQMDGTRAGGAPAQL